MQWCLFCLAIAGVLVGCSDSGPSVAPVRGLVTLDGTPVPGITVQFYPVGGGRASTGTTDVDGIYQLLYSIHEAGAIVGQHQVCVYYDDDQETSGLKRMKVPGRYEENSDLIVEVKRGKNTIDLPLVE